MRSFSLTRKRYHKKMAQTKASIEKEPVLVDPKDIIQPREIPPEEVPEIVAPMFKLAEELPGKKSLVMNIETLGFKPWEDRIITISYQDAADLLGAPTVLMIDDEKELIKTFYKFWKEGEYNQIIGYNLSFDFRYILVRAMFYAIPSKEFSDASLFDMMEIMQKMRRAFVYGSQPTGTLSQWGELFFNYPKPFSDLEMMKYYKEGQFDKVYEFAESQIIRTFGLYLLWNTIVSTEIGRELFASEGHQSQGSNDVDKVAISPETQTVPDNKDTLYTQCKECLSEITIPAGKDYAICPICKATVRR